jgi:hypothetical protein
MKLPAIAFLLATAFVQGGEATLRGHSLDEWRALIEPAAKDLAYAEIPWRPSFWSAVQEAQEHELPILLWAMNGHPLGCT